VERGEHAYHGTKPTNTLKDGITDVKVLKTCNAFKKSKPAQKSVIVCASALVQKMLVVASKGSRNHLNSEKYKEYV
jgi:hypothetical protein